MTQLICLVSGDNIVFYFSTISLLRFQQETKWVNINFERRDLTSAQKSHPFHNEFGEIFVFNIIKQNVTHFSFIFLTTFLFYHEKLKYKLLLPGTVSFFTSYQRWVIRQRFLIGAPLPASASSPPWYVAPPNSHIQKQIIPGCIGIEMLFSFQSFSRNIKKWKVASSILRHKGNLNKHLNACFLWTFEYRRKRRVNKY